MEKTEKWIALTILFFIGFIYVTDCWWRYKTCRELENLTSEGMAARVVMGNTWYCGCIIHEGKKTYFTFHIER